MRLKGLGSEQYGRKFADDIFKFIIEYENCCNLMLISLEFVHMGLLDSKAALVQVMTWGQTDGKNLPEPIVTKFCGAIWRH